MKLIYIANINLPTQKAHGLQIMKMCEAFSKQGLEVELLISQRRNFIHEEIFDFYNIESNFKIKKLFCLDFLRSKFFGKTTLFIQYVSFSLSVFFYILFQPNKYKKEDIFYCRDEFSPWILGVLNKKVYLETHHFHKRFIFYRLFFLKISGLILITENARKKFIELGFKKEKILAAPDAVDLDIFDLNISKEEARNNLALPQDKKVLVYTGKFKTMGEDKGLHDILQAMKILNDNRILFIAVGGNEQDVEYYKKQVAELGIKNNVKILGHHSQTELAIYQKASDILLMPFPYTQHYAYYMSPLKMFEYMASKRPIIATKLPSVEEVLNNDNSILIQPDNPRDLVKSIVALLDNKELADKISQQAFKDVQEHTWKNRTEKILEFIKYRE